MSENESLAGTADYYQTHDVSEEMEAASCSKQACYIL